MVTSKRFGPLRRRAGRVLATVAVLSATVVVFGPANPAAAAPPVATATITGPAVNPLLGQSAALTITFDNTDTTDAGYEPYVDVRIDTQGADGAGPAVDDGLTGATTSYLGAALAATASFNCNGTNVLHPLTGLMVACPAGTRLVVFQLPFGSFAPSQPVVTLSTVVTMSPLADVGYGLVVSATPGFAFGSIPTGNTPILGPTVTTSVTPQIARLTKTYLGPENETATGPNFPQSYVLAADLPTGVVFSSVQTIDTLPGTHQFSAVNTITPAPSAATDPSTTVPGGTLTRTWVNITGGASASDTSVRYTFYVPLLDAASAPVLDAATGDDVATVNDSSMVVTFTPADVRDALTTATINQDSIDNHTLIAKSIAVQKGSTNLTNVGSSGLKAGDTLQYTVNGQISDFFSDGAIILDDVLGDGQTFVPGTATYTATSEGVTTTGSFDPLDVDVDTTRRTACGDGTSRIQYRLSDALTRKGVSPLLIGGLVHGPTNAGAATFTITFQTVTSDAYACVVGDPPIDEGDHVDNAVTATADLYDSTGVAVAPPANEADTSSTSRVIQAAPVLKELYARNGVIGSFTSATAGDLLTYRVRTSSPSSDFELLTLTDFAPLPILVVNTFSPGAVTSTCSTPAVDHACYGPTDTLHTNGAAPDPVVSTDTTSNSIKFDYGTFNDPTNTATEIDLLFTFQVTSAAYRDGLLFTNQVEKKFQNSFAQSSTSANIVPLTLAEPVLRILKGVASVSNANIIFTGGTQNPSGVTWLAPGATAVAPGFTGAVTSTAIAGGAPDANVTKADAGDLVRFAIVVENTGSSGNGAFDVAINDNFPAGFVVPAAGIRLLVTNGAGTTLPNTPSGFLAGAGGTTGTITLNDGATGALGGGTANVTGTNIAVITYELEVAATALPNTVNTNTTNLTGFSGSEGGPSFIGLVAPGNETNSATVTTAVPSEAKTVVGTDQPHTAGTSVAIGEVVTYQVVVTVPEGTTPAMSLVDTLPPGATMAIVSIDSITPDAALTTTVAGGFPTILTNARATLAPPGSSASFTFGDVTNSNRDNTVTELITVQYKVIVLNVVANQSASTRTNSAVLSYTGGNSTVGASVTIVEPVLVTTKTAAPANPDANDTITYVVDVRHVGSGASAFEVSTVDVIPAGLTFVGGSLQTVGGFTVPTTIGNVGSTITVTWNSLVLGAFGGQFTYQATLDPNAAAPFTRTNTATTTWTSVPGSSATTAYNTDDTERTGAGAPLNDYTNSGSATVTVANPQIVKSLYATDDATTSGANVTIGEHATYQLLVTLPESSISGFQIRDAIPTGLRYVGGSAIIITNAAASNGQLGSDFAGTLGPTTFTPTSVGTTDTLTLDVAATTQVTSDNVTTNNSFLIRFDVVVADVAGNAGAPATVLNNSATVQLNGGSTFGSNVLPVTVVEPKLVVTKSFSPNGATPGSTVTVTLLVQNSGLSNGYESVLTDTLDARFDSTTVASVAAPVGWTFGRSGADLTWTADPGTAHASGATLTFTFTVLLKASNVSGATIPNIGNASTTSRLGSIAGERTTVATGSANLLVITPDLKVTKNDSQPNAAPGNQRNYVITVTNTGLAPAKNVTLIDTVPISATYLSLTGPFCSSVVVTPTTRTYSLGTIAANGGIVTCTIRFTIDNPAPAGTTSYVNSASVADDGTNGADPTPANNSASDIDTKVAVPDLVVTKTDGVVSLIPGATTSYGVTVTNSGNVGATNVLIADTLPPVGFVYSGCTQDSGSFVAGCTLSGGVVSTTLTVLAGGGGTAHITVSGTIVTPAPAGLNTITNSVHVSDDGANGTDSNLLNNTATDVDAIDAAPDFVTTKISSVPSGDPGTTVDYTITVANNGNQDATGVTVSDPMPSGSTVVCSAPVPTPAPATCTPSTITWTHATFPVGTTITYTFRAKLANPMPAGVHTITNTATASDAAANGADPTPANNAASSAVTVTGYAVELGVTKTDGIITTTPGSSLSYSMVVTNTGNIGASAVTVTDTLPAGTTFVSAPNTGYGVGIFAAGVVTWTIPVLAGGGATAALTVNVAVASPAPAGLTQLVNSVTVGDDGNNGSDTVPANNTATDTDALTAAPDLAVTKSDGVNQAAPGASLTYTVNVANTGNQNATGITLTDTLPPGVTFASASDSGVLASNVVTWPLFNLAGGANRNFTVSVTVISPAGAGLNSITNTATATDDGTNGADVTANNTGTDVDTITAAPDLSVTKTDTLTTTTPGSTLTYGIVVTNHGTQDATGVTVADTVPAGTTFVSAADIGSGAGTFATGVVTWNIGALPVGATRNFTVTVTVDSPATAGRTVIANNITVADDGTNGLDLTPSDNAALDSDTLLATPDLVVTKNDNMIAVQPGDHVVYTISVQNVGDQNASGVILTDAVPAGTTFFSATGGPTLTSGQLTWPTFSLAGGGVTQSFSVEVIVVDPVDAAREQISNIATAHDDGTNGIDPTPGNNSATDTDTLDALPDLEITKTDGRADITPGETASYTLTITNSGNQRATGILVTDTIPAGTTYDSASDSGVLAAGAVTWPLFSLVAGATTTFTLDVLVTNPATASRTTIVNIATVADDGTGGGDPTPANNSITDTDTLVAAPDLRITKTDNASATSPGQTLVYTLTVTNAGDQNATGVVLSDTVPAGTTFVSASANGADLATLTAGVVAWPAFNLDGGSTIVVTVTVDVDTPALAGRDLIVNSATVNDDGTNGTDPNTADNIAIDTDTLDAAPDLSITKTDGVTTTTPGSSLTYTLTVTNHGTQDATGVTVADGVPGGTTFVSAADVGSGAGIRTGGVVNWNVGSVPAGATRNLTVTFTVNSPATASRAAIVNTAGLTDDGTNGTDPTSSDNNTADVDTLVAAPDLVVTKTNGVSTVHPADTLTYTIVVTNVGDQNAVGVVLTDLVPAGTTFDSATGSPTLTAGLLTWPAFSLTGGGVTRTFSVTVIVVDPVDAGRDQIANTASAVDNGLNGVDPTPANNTATDTDLLGAAPDIIVTKSDGITDASVGDTVVYTVTVSNVGDQDATGLLVVDTLPAGVAFVVASAGGTLTTDVVAWPAFDLPASGVTMFTVTVTVIDPAAAGIDDLANVVTANDDGTNGVDPSPANNTDIDTDVLQAAPDLTITKTDGIASAAPNESMTYTIVVNNVGDQDATGVEISDVVPLGVTFDSAPDTGVGAGTNTAGTVAWPAFALAAGATVTVTVTVIVDPSIPAALEQLTNMATVVDDADNGADPTPANNTAIDIDDLIARPDLVVTKTDARTEVRPGDTVTYTITVTNTSDQDATGVATIDTLPLGTVFVSATDGATNAAGIVTWPIVPIAAGEVVTHSVTVTVAVPFGLPLLELRNVVHAFDDGTGGTDPTPDDNTAVDVDTVDNSLDLGITKSNGTISSTPGTYTTWQITITNHGPVAVPHFTMIDTLPAQLSDVSYQSSAGTYDPATGTWIGPPINVGGTVTISVTGLIAPDATGNLVNEASVAPLDGLTDPSLRDNSATDTDVLVSEATMTIVKTAAGPSAMLGGAMLYTITVTNNGPSTATHVSVLDAMPPGLRLDQVLHAEGWTCVVEATTSVTCSLDNPLAPNAEVTLQIDTTTIASGDVRNVAVLSATLGGNSVSQSDVALIAVSRILTIPNTGADVAGALSIAFLLLTAGALLLVTARRRVRSDVR